MHPSLRIGCYTPTRANKTKFPSLSELFEKDGGESVLWNTRLVPGADSSWRYVLSERHGRGENAEHAERASSHQGRVMECEVKTECGETTPAEYATTTACKKRANGGMRAVVRVDPSRDGGGTKIQDGTSQSPLQRLLARLRGGGSYPHSQPWGFGL